MTVQVVGQLVTADGSNVRSRFDATDLWHPIKYDIWSVRATEVRSVQEPTIPLRLAHGGAAVGELVHLERRDDGSLWAVGEIDGDLDIPPLDIYMSVEADYNEGGTDIRVRGAALCTKSCTIGLQPTTVLRSGLDQFGRRSLGSYQQGLLERAKTARRHRARGEPIVVEGARVEPHTPTTAQRSSGIEVRSAGIVDVSRPLREVDLLIVPHELPSVIYERSGRYSEVFSVGAFSEAETNPGRIKLNFAHEIERVVGRAIQIDAWAEQGCIGRFKISKTVAGNEALELMADDVVTPSAGFQVPDESGVEWNHARTTRRVRKAKLHHCALTADAAHETAVLAIRHT